MENTYFCQYIHFLHDQALALLFWHIIFKTYNNEEEKLKMLEILNMFTNLTAMRDEIEIKGEFYRIDQLSEKLSEIQRKFQELGYESSHGYIEFTREFAFEIMKYHEIKKKISSKNVLFHLYEKQIKDIRSMRDNFENGNLRSKCRKDGKYLKTRIKLITVIREKIESDFVSS